MPVLWMFNIAYYVLSTHCNSVLNLAISVTGNLAPHLLLAVIHRMVAHHLCLLVVVNSH